MSVENFTTNVDNVRQDSPEWVKQNIKNELSSFQGEMFYEIKWNQVEYHMDTVVSYLENIKNLEWNELKNKWSAWVMSVQIALESIKDDSWTSKSYVGIIDGQFWPNTKNEVRKFQEDCWFTWKDLDGYPGKKTIWKLLVMLWWTNQTEAWAEKAKIDEVVDQAGMWVSGNSSEVKEKNNKELPSEIYASLKKRVSALLETWDIYSDNPCYVNNMGTNPEFQVYTHHPKDVLWQNDITYTFNFHNYLSDDWEFDENALEQDIRKKLWKKIDERNEWRSECYRCWDLISSIKNKSYSVEDLFWTWKKPEWVKVFFGKFSDNRIKFSGVYQNMNEWTIRFEFEIKWRNSKVNWYKQTIDKNELKDEKWNYSENKFKEKLKKLVETIAKENYWW